MSTISESRHGEGLSTRGIFGQRPAPAVALAVLLATLLAAGCGPSATMQAQTSETRTPATPTPTRIAGTPTTTLSCGEPGRTATSPTAPVPSLPPAEILSAVEALPGFQNPVQVAEGLAPSGSTYSYDPPVLVLPATVGDPEGNGSYSHPHYIIRASVNGVRMVTYDVTYNPTTQVFSLNSFGPMLSNDPGYCKPFPWVGVSSGAAVAALRSAKGLALAASTVPELVFFSPGPQLTNTKSPTPSTWTGGGYSPIYPMWRLHGADGQLYFVGIDGNVYTPKQLPILPGTTFITQG